MKTLLLAFSFLKKNVLPFLLTLSLLTVSQFLLITVIGNLRYRTYASDVLRDPRLVGGWYFTGDWEPDPEVTEARAAELRADVRALPGCGALLEIARFSFVTGEETRQALLFDRGTRERFALPVEKGRWLSPAPETTEAVVGGPGASAFRPGDVLTDRNGITAVVVGILGENAPTPSFSAGGNGAIAADRLFRAAVPVVILTRETVPEDAVPESANLRTDPNFFVLPSSSASDEESAALLALLEAHGTPHPGEEILRETERQNRAWAETSLPLPCFLTAVSALCLLSVSAVAAERGRADLAKYYLLGCPPSKGLFLPGLPLSLSAALSCLLNYAAAARFPHFLRAGKRSGAIDYLIDGRTALPVLLIGAALFLLLSLLPALLYRDVSPIDGCRRAMS